MRRASICTTLGCLLLVICLDEIPAQETRSIGVEAIAKPSALDEITRKHHSWGNFSPGAWKLVHVAAETLDAEGNVTDRTITLTKTTLTEVGQRAVTLEVEMTMEVAGKLLTAPARTVKQGFHGELYSEGLVVDRLGDDEVAIEGRKVPCKVFQVERADSSGKTVTRLYFSETLNPHILRRQSLRTGAEDDSTAVSKTTLEIVAVDMPWPVLEETCASALVRSIHEHPGGNVCTVSITSPAVPGGVVCHTSKELDKEGVLVRRSTLELVDFGLEPEASSDDDSRSGALSRFRSRWSRRLPKALDGK